MTTTTYSRLALVGVVLAGVSAVTAVLAGFGSRWQWWHFTAGFSMLRWAVFGALGAIAMCAAGLFTSRKTAHGRGWAVSGLVVGLVVVAIPVSWLYTAVRVPPIHDITTDTDNPPQFEAILPLRNGAADSAVYGGPAVALQQRRAYPDIAPLVVNAPAASVFPRALQVARRLGWEVVSADSGRGRIEATDTTFWFGFKDDIVVRVKSDGQGTRVDVRSVSRVGRSDVGTNAARIRRYLASLREALSG